MNFDALYIGHNVGRKVSSQIVPYEQDFINILVLTVTKMKA